MACDAERTNVEFLELLEEMAEREKNEAFGALNEAMRELADSCGPFMQPGDPEAYNIVMNVPELAEFLERLRNGELSPECEQIFDDVVSRMDEAQEQVQHRNQFRKAHEEARRQLRDCMHGAQTGGGGA